MASSHSSGSQQSGGTAHGGSGNFANDPQRASEAGNKGGQHSHSGSHESHDDAERTERSSSGTVSYTHLCPAEFPPPMMITSVALQ